MEGRQAWERCVPLYKPSSRDVALQVRGHPRGH